MVNKVADLSEGLQWSKNRLEAVTGFSRHTINARLEEARVKPCGKIRRYDVYNPREALPALYLRPGAEGVSVFTDPNAFYPKDRKDWYASEESRLKVEEKNRTLIPVNEFSERMSVILQTIASALDRAPGDMERELSWNSTETESFERALDAARQALSNELYKLAQEGDSENEETADGQ